MSNDIGENLGEKILVTKQEAEQAVKIVWEIVNNAFKDGYAAQIVLGPEWTKELWDWHLNFMKEDSDDR